MTYYLGQIIVFAGNFVPKYFAACDGQLLPVAQYGNLYSLIGNTYGGDSVKFALPDLRSRLALGDGRGTSRPKEGGATDLTEHPLGSSGGSEQMTFSIDQMPSHRHVINAIDLDATSGQPIPQMLANVPEGTSFYFTEQPGARPATRAVMGGGTLSSAGQAKAHENRMLVLPLSYIMCVDSVFPNPQ